PPKCPLLCVFYAEFDIVVGPKVCTPLYEGDNSTVDTDTLQNSIFAATSEYIITGNELANQTITVSTHGMHILSRPMIISDTKRYERNSLLFAVGFVLRRNVDPRPYWPVLSNLSSTFRSMEVESEFLSHSRTRSQIQIVLEDVLVSLNSKQKDCHLLLDDANLLNLQLFRPPPPPTPPVPDYAVPILLRPEWQLQMYDWDLTINWIVPHIDGCKYVKQIAQSSEVDMDMIRACLRVLKHHGVLAHVDIFRYSNVYECTPLALELFSTKKFASHAQSQLHRDRTDRNNIDETLETTLARLYCACNRKESDDNLTWEKAFDCFDHRRLITFGIVRGLINRVHQYPMVYEVEID
ncbi:hypothetical protein THAPSDRAFT_261392, partial [Thalassiosira pseudonana CCMP1335]